MCILFLAVKQHLDYPLIIAANRDEYFARESKPMHWWLDRPNILAGKDMVAGGAWLGINRKGNFAAVTNFRDPSRYQPEARSRGELPLSYLTHEQLSQKQTPFGCNFEFGRRTALKSTAYNPFNLIYGDHRALYAYSHGDRGVRILSAGCHSVSNGHIDSQWPKMSRGVALLQNLATTSGQLRAPDLAQVMQDTQPAPEDQLPTTGLSLDREKALSSIFIQGKDYGTRTTTILMFSCLSIQIMEINYDETGQPISESTFDVGIH